MEKRRKTNNLELEEIAISKRHFSLEHHVNKKQKIEAKAQVFRCKA